MTAWATASVTTSASVTLRLAFLARSGRRSSAVAEHGREQQVEVGEHRGPLGRRCELGTADFDLLLTNASPRPHGRGINHLGA